MDARGRREETSWGGDAGEERKKDESGECDEQPNMRYIEELLQLKDFQNQRIGLFFPYLRHVYSCKLACTRLCAWTTDN